MLLYLGFVRYFMLGKKEFDFLHSVIYVNTRMFFLDKSHSLKCTQNFSIVLSQVAKVCLVRKFICFVFFVYGELSSLFVATNSRIAPAPNLITLFIKFCRRNTFKIIAKCRKYLNNGGKSDKN